MNGITMHFNPAYLADSEPVEPPSSDQRENVEELRQEVEELVERVNFHQDIAGGCPHTFVNRLLQLADQIRHFQGYSGWLLQALVVVQVLVAHSSQA